MCKMLAATANQVFCYLGYAVSVIDNHRIQFWADSCLDAYDMHGIISKIDSMQKVQIFRRFWLIHIGAGVKKHAVESLTAQQIDDTALTPHITLGTEHADSISSTVSRTLHAFQHIWKKILVMDGTKNAIC